MKQLIDTYNTTWLAQVEFWASMVIQGSTTAKYSLGKSFAKLCRDNGMRT